MEDKWSAEALHLSYTRLFDVFIVALKELESCVCFVVLLRDLVLSGCTFFFLSIVETRYTEEDIVGALLKQLKASKGTSISVKKPENENIGFTNYGNIMWIYQECERIKYE